MDVVQATWAILDACIPRGTAEKLARLMGKSAETINRWKRPSEDDDNIYATGSNNPLDWVELLQDHAFAHAPREAHRIHQYFLRRYENFSSAFATKTLTPELRDKELSDVRGSLLSQRHEIFRPRVGAVWIRDSRGVAWGAKGVRSSEDETGGVTVKILFAIALTAIPGLAALAVLALIALTILDLFAPVMR